jgi:hypothetical protein
MNYTAQSLVEMSDLRNQLIDRVEVLSKVKALFLVPGFNMMPTKMVANFYEVDTDVIQKCFMRNKNEITEDGVRRVTLNDLKGQGVRLDRVGEGRRGHYTFDAGNNVIVSVPGHGCNFFSPRAVLRIGMLLRDSEVAKEVRTQLLNTFECATEEQKTEAIDQEGVMLLSIIRAGSPELMAVELGKYRDFMNRHIAKLEGEKQGLQTELDIVHNEIVTWTPKQITKRLIGSIGYQLGGRPDYAWSKLRQKLYHHHGISLEQRKHGTKASYISLVRDDEWTKVLQEVYALAKEFGIDVVKAVGLINAQQIPDFAV